MIYTCSHKEYISNEFTTYAISGNKGKNAGYAKAYIKELAPKLSFWKIWEENIGKIDELENNKYYIEQYYKQVLSKLDPEEMYKKLDSSILLCYEDNTKFCHRHIVSAWLELMLDVKVPEVTVFSYNITEVEKPTYIKEYLEEIIKANTDMKGFNTLAAVLINEKIEKLKPNDTNPENIYLYNQRTMLLQKKIEKLESNYKHKKRILSK